MKPNETMPKSFRLSEKAVDDLERLAKYWNCDRTEVITRCLHEFAILETEREALQQERVIIEARQNDLMIIQQSIDELKHMVANTNYVPAPQGIQALPGLKSIAMPVFDDEDTIVMKVDTTSGQTASNNFQNSMMAMLDVQFESNENDQQTRHH